MSIRTARAAARSFLDGLFEYRAARAVLKLRPSYLPAAVISKGGRSRWPVGKPIRFITSFNDKMYVLTGQRCVESFRQCNPSVEVISYGEARVPEVLAAMRQRLSAQGIGFVDITKLPLLGDFLRVARDLIPAEYGGDAPDEMFPAVTSTSTGGYFRKNMFRWFRKIVALDHAAQAFDGVLVWMDCDCYAKAPLPREVLARAFGGAGVFYMKANRYITEMGLVGFDLAEPGVRALLGSMKAHYMGRHFVALQNWDDCSTFDYLRARQSLPVCRDIGTWADRGGHILRSTMLSPYLEHDKGAHGRRGQRISYE
jgi:hypothetical protein